MEYIRFFEQMKLSEVALFGGKNASLGEMISGLSSRGIRVPGGFAVSSEGYWLYVKENNLLPLIEQLAKVTGGAECATLSDRLRAAFDSGKMPDKMAQEIEQAYQELSQRSGVENIDVAVRSSATAEDLPGASFAGQQETYLNVVGVQALLDACRKCFASLFTERAVLYRREKGFQDTQVALSIGVQKMVRSDLACSGVMFSLDTESGFPHVVNISAAYGLGENVVQGAVTPDEYAVDKRLMQKGFSSIVRKVCGIKEKKFVYKGSELKNEETAPEERATFCLTDEEIISLAHDACVIEEYYSQLHGKSTPMDMEWAKDGRDGLLYIVQARPETIFGSKTTVSQYHYHLEKLEKKPQVLVQGLSVGRAIASGRVRCLSRIEEADQLLQGEILVTTMTDPDWVAVMKRAAGIITDSGGRTCHAAIVSRELGVPALVGVGNATQVLKTGDEITLDCSQGSTGYVYSGIIPFIKEERKTNEKLNISVPCMLIMADPERAFELCQLPVDGVGLLRLEFIITNHVGVHPSAIVHYDTLTDEAVKKNIAARARPYKSVEEFFIQKLSEGIATIASAFYPKPVIVRHSDFKSNEYYRLIGGSIFEKEEENPMIGFRGATRYLDAEYQPSFLLECAAIKRVREILGFDNITLMVPFVRTPEEARRVRELLEEQKLIGKDIPTKLYMMVEVPSNVILFKEFAQYFDGFSIGSNDLTQLTLGADRDSGLLSASFDERDEAVKYMMIWAIEQAKEVNKPIGICGQAPSDFPELAQLLIKKGISSISVQPDAVGNLGGE